MFLHFVSQYLVDMKQISRTQHLARLLILASLADLGGEGFVGEGWPVVDGADGEKGNSIKRFASNKYVVDM